VGSGDSALEAASLGALSPGDCVLKLGSSANTETIMAAPLRSPAALVYPYVVQGTWIAITATSSGAASLRWFQELVGAIGAGGPPGDGLDPGLAGAAAVAPGAEGLLFHPFLAGERSPYWDPYLRGSFAGIRAGHTRAHFYRAVMEGVAFSLRDCLQALGAMPGGRIRLIGGGARSAPWPQVVADVLGRDLERPARSDASVGSAMLAGIAVGLFRDWPDAVERSPVTAEAFAASRAAHAVYDRLFEAYREAVAGNAAQGRRLARISEASGSVS
jgi:xylulokinase